MIIGILGMPLTGKTTIFNLITSQHKETDAFSSRKTKNIGVAKIVDERVDILSTIYQPKKTTYASIEMIDIPGISSDMTGKTKQEIFTQIYKADALLIVIRTFKDSKIPGIVDPLYQAESLIYEILLHDLEMVGNRITRLSESKRKITNQEKFEKQILERCQVHLESDQLLKTQLLSEEELKILSGFNFFTLKPIIFALNVDENEINDQKITNYKNFDKFIQEHQMASIAICGKLEMEINDLAEEEKKIFQEFPAEKEVIKLMEQIIPRDNFYE